MGQLAEIIAGEIAKAGPISAARFMELALYCPVYGYYEKEEDTVGRKGDFFTSVSVGNLFGKLLAVQFADPCWEGIAGRGLGLIADRRGDSETAVRLVTEARMRCVRLPDAWLWVEGFCLDALCKSRRRCDRFQPSLPDLMAAA